MKKQVLFLMICLSLLMVACYAPAKVTPTTEPIISSIPDPTGGFTPEPTVLEIEIFGWRYEDDILHIENDEGMANWDDLRKTRNEQVVQIKEKVEEIILYEGVTFIANHAFGNCKNLKSIELPEELLTIGSGAFHSCESLTSIVIPDSVMEIGGSAFRSCTSLFSIKLPPGLTRLSAEMIANCTNLGELYIPESVSLIGEFALHCIGSKRIVFEGTIDTIVRIELDEIPNLEQLVFLNGPPIDYLRITEAVDGLMFQEGLLFPEEINFTVYYLSENADKWAPNGETEWNGCPLVAIDSLDDLPPLN